MRAKKLLTVAIAAALLTSTLASVGSLAASAAEVPESIADYATYSGSDLGSNYTKDSTTFKLWAPTSENVKVNLYATGSDDEEGAGAIGTHPMTFDASTGVWSVTVDGDLAGVYYTYTVCNELNPNGVEVCDIYAKAAGVNGNRAMVVDLASTNPAGWENDSFARVEEATDATVWEVHIKDFSYDPESGVSEANRGKYMAFTELQTTLNNAGDVKTCMNYLKDLGINYVQINPMYDFGSVDETGDDTQFNWGYDPKNYNVPEGSYSSNPYDGNVRINEMKQMIQALHENGIGVIMDVVYNHTYASEDSWFNLTVPDYYYRQNDAGVWSNGSGCGNDTASEREMFKNFMVDSVKYWATEYHLDGFRFDLMGLHDVDTMNAVREALDEIDTRIITYGEGWTMGSTTDKENWAGNSTSLCTQAKAMRVNERIGFFNDDARDGIKGKAFDDLVSTGYASGAIGGADNLYKSIIGHYNTSNWKTRNAGQNIMYSCCHDNQTLYDRLVASIYGLDAEYGNRYDDLVSMNKLSAAIVMTSQGVPFMLAGEEFSRTKYGDHNSYRSSPDINMLDWSRVEEYADVVSYYKGLIDIRNNFAAFSDYTHDTGKAMVRLDTPKGVIGYDIANLADAGNQWSNARVYFNGSLTESYDVELPEGASGIFGDIDGDGQVTVGDAIAILRVSSGLDTFTDRQKYLADMDNNGFITVGDAIAALRVDAKLDEARTADGSAEWVVVANDQTAGLSAIETVSGKATLKPNSALILVPKDTFSAANLQEEEDSYVVVNHVDRATGEVLAQNTIKGVEGQKYSTQMAKSLLVEYDYNSCSDNVSGTMTKGTTNVYYYYDLFEGGIGTLTVRYVDESGKDLEEPTVTTARGGTEYSVQPKPFAWMTLDETQLPTNTTGTYNKNGTEVVFHYKTLEQGVTSTIHVKVNDASFTPNIYVWDSKGTMSNAWPGTKMADSDGDGWLDFTFENGTVYNWILNDGSSQTADMVNYSGDLWIIAEGSVTNLILLDKEA
ncbi:MAG: type I pullulanase [Lachnospiraceae bacterium]|nr:type I pullulanase [Lachnospiraceae bacterium]